MPVLRRVAAALSLATLILIGFADTADAHAVLLRSEPGPQSTVTDPPPAVRLTYSEPVEVAFGAIRVFDVDGGRVDTGAIERASGGREVSVELPTLADGTYTVTWRVVSADGHAVRGGFVFYVGAPSSISAVAIDADASASSAVGWTYGVVRWAWFVALAALAGFVAARRWVWTPAVRAAGLEDSPAADAFRDRFRWMLPSAWVVLAVATVGLLVFQAAAVSGLPLGSAARAEVVRELLRTTFGDVWLVQAVLVAALAVPVIALVSHRRLLGVGPRAWLLVFGAGVVALCAAAPGAGHARTARWPGLALAATSVHLLAVLAWVGGLAAVVVLGGAALRRRELIGPVVARFGRVGVASVVVLTVTGTVLSVANLASVSDLWRTDYGRLIVAKVVALQLALVLAARHRWLEPGPRFRLSAALEVAVLVGALALASGLMAAVPGRSLALAARGPVDQERAIGQYTVQLFIDPSEVGENELHLTFTSPDVTNATATLDAPLELRLLAPGHFVADATLPRPGPYELRVELPGGEATTFTFKIGDD